MLNLELGSCMKFSLWRGTMISLPRLAPKSREMHAITPLSDPVNLEDFKNPATQGCDRCPLLRKTRH